MSPTPEETEKMKKLRKQGLSSRETAEIVDCTHPTVLKYTRQTI
jgi:DNA-binding CsgD family transcriptional regulator